MSIKLMAQVWEKEFSHSEQAVLLAMADYADDNGSNCYPSYDRLAWKTGYSARQVQRIIKGLVTQGVLLIVKPATQHQSTRYSIRLALAKDKTAFRVDIPDTQGRQDVHSESLQGRQMEHPGWTNETSRVDTVSTDPPYNHHIETPGKAAAPYGFSDVGKAWTDNMSGTLTPFLIDQLKELEKEYNPREIVGAIEIAVKRNRRTLSYVEGILRRGVDLPPMNTVKPKTAAYITDPVTGERREVMV